jgi:hypothetical protein
MYPRYFNGIRISKAEVNIQGNEIDKSFFRGIFPGCNLILLHWMTLNTPVMIRVDFTAIHED